MYIKKKTNKHKSVNESKKTNKHKSVNESKKTNKHKSVNEIKKQNENIVKLSFKNKKEKYSNKKNISLKQNINKTKKRQQISIFKHVKKICCDIDIQKNSIFTKYNKYKSILSRYLEHDNSVYSIIQTLRGINKLNITTFKDFKDLDFYLDEKLYINNLKKKEDERYKNQSRFNSYLKYSENATVSFSQRKASFKVFTDNGILELIKVFGNEIKFILLHPNSNMNEKKNLNNLMSKLNLDNKCKVIVEKDIQFSFKGICSLLYMITAYNELKTFTEIVSLTNKLGYNKKYKNKSGLYTIKCLVVYDKDNKLNLDNFHNISNHNNYYHKELLNQLNIETSHIIYKQNQIIDIANSIFNWNSISFLEKQMLYKFIKMFSIYDSNSSSTSSGFHFINNFKNYLAQNIAMEDRERFMITGGGMIYIYGLRRPQDLDFFINKYPTKQNTDGFNKLISEDFINENTKVEEWDAIYPPLKWKDFYEEYHSEWAATVGGKNMLQCMIDPRYHFYYMGLKFITMELELYRRNTRGRPAAVADIIAINHFLGYNTKIKPIAKKVYIKYPGKEDAELVLTNENKFISTVVYKLRLRYGIIKTKLDIKKLITFN